MERQTQSSISYANQCERCVLRNYVIYDNCVSFGVPCCCMSIPGVRRITWKVTRRSGIPSFLATGRMRHRMKFFPQRGTACPFCSRRGVLGQLPPGFDDRPHRVQLVLSVDNMNAKVSGCESMNGAAEPGRDLLEIDVFDGTKSARAKNRCNTSRLETADRTFINFLKLFGPLRF